MSIALAIQATTIKVDPLHRPFDEILDVYVRDGLVYYLALRNERARFDRYVQSLGEVTAATVSSWPTERQLAYWINAYNAFVLRNVIDNYPIRGKAADYPSNSVRQIAGAFERRTFRAGGRTLTLDALERDVIAAFNDPRALLALSRGAMGGPRLKSEAFTEDRLDAQLATMQSELVTRRELVFVDVTGERLSVNPLFSWREEVFSKALANRAPEIYGTRSPLERAVLSLIDPLLVPSEREFLRKNTFRMVFHEFDWRLNDLTGR
ncbi:MAG TPA: DUF547 domain-containing protein [Vicinamibacterales bacterium]|nr:DUF547 domain-containing protein [Vicinamibacterales bacterium]